MGKKRKQKANKRKAKKGGNILLGKDSEESGELLKAQVKELQEILAKKQAQLVVKLSKEIKSLDLKLTDVEDCIESAISVSNFASEHYDQLQIDFSVKLEDYDTKIKLLEKPERLLKIKKVEMTERVDLLRIEMEERDDKFRNVLEDLANYAAIEENHKQACQSDIFNRALDNEKIKKVCDERDYLTVRLKHKTELYLFSEEVNDSQEELLDKHDIQKMPPEEINTETLENL